MGDGRRSAASGRCRRRRSPESRSTSRRCRRTCRAQIRCLRPALPSIVTGKAAPISGIAMRSNEPVRHRPSGVAPRADERRGSAPARRNRMASDVPSDCTNASSVCLRIAGSRSAPLSAAATALAERVAGSFSSISWSVRKYLERNAAEPAARPRTSGRAAATVAFEEKALPTFSDILTPATQDFSFQMSPTAYLLR